MTNKSGTIQSLNDDCLMHIFQYLPIIDRIRIERVCQQWRIVSLRCWRTFKTFDLSRTSWGLTESDKYSYVDTQVITKILNRCGRFLINFDISKSFNENGTISRKDPNKVHIIGATGNILNIIETTCSPYLQTIFISDPCINLSGLRSLISKCKNISKFSLVTKKWIWDEDKLGILFSSMSNLKYLKFSCNNVTGKCLFDLPETIEEVHLLKLIQASCRQVSRAINKFSNLKSLTIDSYPYIEADLLKAIASQNKSLKNLRLSGYVGIDRMTKQEIKEISKFENLEFLDFRHNCYITNEALETLAESCKRIFCINISYCYEVSEKGISHLATKLNLTKLLANGLLKITGENFRKMDVLKCLECRNCHRLKEENLTCLIRENIQLEIMDVSWNKFDFRTFINVVDLITRNQQERILKLYVGHNVDFIEISSPFLNIIYSSSDEFCRESF